MWLRFQIGERNDSKKWKSHSAPEPGPLQGVSPVCVVRLIELRAYSSLVKDDEICTALVFSLLPRKSVDIVSRSII